MKLTVAQTEIYLMYGRGMRVREIAAARGVLEATIRRQMMEARDSTGAKSAAQLAVMVALAHAKMQAK